jgi:cytochrome c556
LIVLAGALFLGSAVWSQCSKPAPRPSPSPTSTPLLGDMKPVVSVKELMADMIDPLADNIFDAVWWASGQNGTEEHRPRTDADWDKVKVGAVTLAEGIYLLKVPRPFAPAGDLNNSVGPNAFELSPAQIQAKLDKDPVLWNAKIEALRNVALETLEAVKKKDVDALFEAGGDLDAACEECHLDYWYPGDRKRAPR